MRRRPFLLACTTACFGGCLRRDSTTSSPGSGDGPDGDQRDPNGLAITEVYPDEEVRGLIDYEYVRIENVGDASYQLQGVQVLYDDERSYRFDSLRIEPGAVVYLVSRSQDDGRFDTEPPGYVRSAHFGDSPQTSVMEGNGTVTLRTPDGKVLDERRY